MIIAFHPDLNLPRLYIYWSYGQTNEDLTSLHHFDAVQRNFFYLNENFNMKTLKQLQNAVLAVKNRKDNRALAEMFSIELLFKVDCPKFWLKRNLKQIELDENAKDEFIQKTLKKTCCICDFPIKSRAENGWFDHVCKAEYLFLENIFPAEEMHQMGFSNFNIYYNKKIKKILDSFDDFCEDLKNEHKISLVEKKTNPQLDDTIKQIKNIKIKGEEDKTVTKKKVIAFLYKKSINFLPTDKIATDFIVSEKFLTNLFFIYTDHHVIHHSHVTSKIIDHAHEHCNLQVRENYFTIPVIAHNQFRFDFFLFLKGLIPSVWETTDINIGGKNPTSINFAKSGQVH